MTAGESAANRFYAYGVVARLALLAAAVELEQTADRVEEVSTPVAAAVAG
jgi:glutamate--cysteine ligase